MRVVSRFFTVLLFLIAIPISGHAALSVEDLRFGTYQDNARIVLELNQPSDFRAFTLNNPSRLVIDLPEFNWKPAKLQNIETSMVKKVRQGVLEPGISRIVLDLEQDSAISRAFLLKPDHGYQHRLVIDYAASANKAAQAKRFGSLSTAEPQTVNTAVTPQVTPSVKKAATPRKPVVVIDAGHGGVDPGAVGKGDIYEKNITLAIAKKLRDQLQRTGRYKVVMTREDDRFLKLYQRVAIARQHKGDLFMSIHADSIRKASVSGASIYTLSDKASDEQTARLAARENKADLIGGVDLSVEDKDVANILLDLVRRDTMNQSNFFAGSIVSAFEKENIQLLERPHRSAGFAVLKAPDIPSVLVETGFVSNNKEARMLTRSDYQEKIAATLKEGIDRYFERLALNQSL